MTQVFNQGIPFGLNSRRDIDQRKLRAAKSRSAIAGTMTFGFSARLQCGQPYFLLAFEGFPKSHRRRTGGTQPSSHGH
jgi:hypothetical protein